MKKTERLEKEPVKKLLLNMAIPSIISLLMNSINVTVDRMFVGICVGTVGISAVTISYGIYLLMQGLSQLVSVGSASVIAIKLGKQNQKDAEKVLGNVFTLSFMLSLLISFIGYIFMRPLLRIYGANNEIIQYAVEYTSVLIIGSLFFVFAQSLNCVIRGMGYAKRAMVNFMADIITNIIMDFIFVYLLHLGVFGAALATTLSSGICAILAFCYLCSKKNNVRINKKNFKLDRNIVKSIIMIGCASAVIQLTMSLSTLIYNRVALIYGGTTCVAAYGIVSTLLLLVYMPIIGLTQGMQPIIGYNLGAGNISRIKETLKYGLLYGTCFTIIALLLMELFSETLINGFGGKNDYELLKLGIRGLKLTAASLPLFGIVLISVNYFQYIKKSSISMILTLFRQIVLIIPLVIILPIFYGINGIFTASLAADIISGIVAIILLVREITILNEQITKMSS